MLLVYTHVNINTSQMSLNTRDKDFTGTHHSIPKVSCSVLGFQRRTLHFFSHVTTKETTFRRQVCSPTRTIILVRATQSLQFPCNAHPQARELNTQRILLIFTFSEIPNHGPCPKRYPESLQQKVPWRFCTDLVW